MLIKNKIGCHLSIKNSLLNIFKEAEELEITTIACFTGSNLKYNNNINFNNKLIDIFKKKINNENYTVFSHASYLINIANKNKYDNYQKSILAIEAELIRCNLLNIKGIAFHPGSNENKNEGLRTIAESLNIILEKYEGTSELYIESSAGEGSKIPSQLEEIQYIINFLTENAKKKIGIVIDTCHIFAAGYDLNSENAIDSFLLKFENTIGIENIKLIHLNNSKKKCGSKIDRHESLTKGEIKISNIQYLLKNDYIRSIPKILETPVDNYIEWKDELFLLKNLLNDDIMNI